MNLRTLVSADWRLLVRDRAALFLTFVLPLVFFTIFAFIFGGMGGSGGGDLKPLRVIAIDEDHSELSAQLLDALFEAKALIRLDAPDSVDAAVAIVREGDADAALVVGAGFAERFGAFGSKPPVVRLVFDAANPMARFTIEGLVQAASFQAAPLVLMESGFGALEQFGGGATPAQRIALDALGALLEGDGSAGSDEADGEGDASAGFGALVAVQATAATERDDGVAGPSMVDYYAAAIGVMFLLFSMTGAAGALLEEEERGTLERLLMSGVGIGPVLLGHWLFFALLGAAQLALMFVFAWLVFGLDLLNVQVLVGVSIVGLVTATAASAFALFLAAACRTRAQLSGLSTVVILIMSAVGGSMVPRFVMPAIMDTLSRFTFNGWALDGFLAVLWQRDPSGSLGDVLVSIALPVGVLLAATAGLLYGARRLARRWETV
jgi:ABC-2 type transport system permease protein